MGEDDFGLHAAREWTYTEVADPARSPRTYEALANLERMIQRVVEMRQGVERRAAQEQVFGWRATLELGEVLAELEQRIIALEERLPRP